MKHLTLHMRYGEQPLRDAAAWFITGAEPADWLAEIAEWGVALVDLTLYVVPRSASDLSPLGVLVVSPAKNRPAVTKRAVPYRRLAGRLYLPTAAVLSPPVTESELAALLAPGIEAYVWHPTAGLVGFEPGEGRRFAQLLSVPPRVDCDWGRADPGVPINQQLRSVLPTEFPAIEEILEEGRGDIGTQQGELSQLPEIPGETNPGMLTRLGAGALSTAAQAGQWLLDFLPKTASAETWADRLQAWLAGVGQAAANRMNLLSDRERELRRLLGLLASDPDQGLKFALPFGGGSHRGLARPSGQLVARDVNFNLDRLRGGEAADFWDVPPQIQHDLIREYRRLAERELRLGRHRRAAYIFAELVNDLAAAAAALVAGGHFREAAVLYHDRLKNPLEAARCLEKGRLWSEALLAYEELREFEKAGDLSQTLDQEEDASRLYRLAVSAAAARDDMLTAARVLDQKLRFPDEALEHLRRGWTLRQAASCVAETFRLLGRLGRHEEAGRELEWFVGPRHSVEAYHYVIDEVAGVARTYPDELIRDRAADTVRVMAALRLEDAPPGESRTLLAAVSRLAPEDRLLDRDCRRFVNASPRAPRPIRRAALSIHTTTREAVLVQELRIPDMHPCFAATTSDLWYYMAGYSQSENLTVVRGHWNNPKWQSLVDWPVASAACHAPVVLEADAYNPTAVIVHLVHAAKTTLSEKTFAPDDLISWPIPVGSPPWATESTLAIAKAGNGTSWALDWSHGMLVLAGYTSKNVPVASLAVDLPADLLPAVTTTTALPIPMQVRESTFYIGLGECLVIVNRDGRVETIEMPQPIRRFACSALHTRRRVALTFGNGGRLLWDDVLERYEEPFGPSLAFPVAGFTKLGWLIVAASDMCQIYSTNNRQLRLEASCPMPNLVPVAILDTGTANEFAVCFAEGTIRTYRIPSRV